MKKYCDWWLLPLLACLLAGCGDDDYHYPSVKLEFLTAFSGADGYLRSVVTDEGETLPVVEGAFFDGEVLFAGQKFKIGPILL